MEYNTNQEQFNGFLNSQPIFKEKSALLPYANFDIKKGVIQHNINFNFKDNLMLGKRVEYYFKKYIELQSEYRILVENLQIIHDKITIGEIDFILEKENLKYHVELSYKFYLYDPTIGNGEIENWIGPNRNDSLSKKINKLNKKQLPLLTKTATKKTLDSLGVHSEDCIQNVCYLGQLFVPKHHSSPVFKEVNRATIQGTYQNYQTFLKTADTQSKYFLPSKTDWLSRPQQEVAWSTFKEIKNIIEVQINQKKSPMLWIQNQKGTYSKEFITWW